MAIEEKVQDNKQVEKISKEHLEDLQKCVNRLNSLQFNIGKIEFQKHSLLHDLAVVNDEITLLQDKMKKEYGSFDINLKDGSINRVKNEK
jgi:hypothetical protein